MGQRGSREPAGKPPLSARGRPRSSFTPGSLRGKDLDEAESSDLAALVSDQRDAKSQVVVDVLEHVNAALAALEGVAGEAAAAAVDQLNAAQLRLQREQTEDDDAGFMSASKTRSLSRYGLAEGDEDVIEVSEESDDDDLDDLDKSMRIPRLTSQAVLDRVASATCDQRSWLLGTYTNIDLEASNNHHALGAIHREATSLSRKRTVGRMKTDERGLLTKAALASPCVSEMMDEAEDLDFDALVFCSLPEVGSQPITVLGTYLAQTCGLVFEMKAQGQLSDSAAFERRFLSFLGRLDCMYKKVAYHNSAHAVNVMSMMAWFLSSDFFSERTTPLDRFMSIVAAAIHDVAHPGVTNLFLSKTMSPLALRYNDVAILENMHVATAFETMHADDHCNWLKLLEEASLQDGISAQPRAYVRRGLISMVLATDLSKHAAHQTGLETFPRPRRKTDVVEPSQEADRVFALDQHLFLLGAALHAADIGHSCKPQDQMMAWSKCVLSEFWAQGDEERRLGLGISPLCDRASGRDSVPNAQLGFFRFVVQPYYKALTELIHEAEEACEQLERNQEFWVEKNAEHATYEQLFNVVRTSRRQPGGTTLDSLPSIGGTSM